MLDKVKKFVDKSFNKKNIHLKRTLYWLKQLNPDVDETMQIAAYSHDIERAFNKLDLNYFKTHKVNDLEYLKRHQEGGAKIISDFLRKYRYPENSINRIAEMIRFHEIGGTKESDLIKDADSLSYFDVNAIRHIKTIGKILGKTKLKSKFDLMYNRITSKKAKKIAEPMYKKALELLNKL